MKVRNTLTFTLKEKNIYNLLYRRIIHYIISNNYITTDFLFSIEPVIYMQNNRSKNLMRIIDLAKVSPVELMVHPARQNEYDYLLSSEFLTIISDVKKISYASLNSNSKLSLTKHL